MMLNMQAQERTRDTVIGVVYREVAENAVVFKETIQKQLEEKQAEEARKLREMRRDLAHADIVDVAKSKLNAEEAKDAPAASATPAITPEPQAVRGSAVDIKA